MIFLVFGLSTSTFLLDDYLSNTMLNSDYSVAQFSYAIEQKNNEALTKAWQKQHFIVPNG